MDSNIKYNKNIWSNISKIIDKTVIQIPLTVLVLPLLFVDTKWFKLIPVTLICDILFHGGLFLYQHCKSYFGIKKNHEGCMTGDMELVDSPLIQQFNEVIHLAFKGYESRLPIKNNIQVFKNSHVNAFKPLTIPDLTTTTIILVHKKFNENSLRDIAFLAHEFGHTFHTLMRQEKYAVPVICTLYQLIMLAMAVYTGSWYLFFATLMINGFLVKWHLSEFNSRIEKNATLLGLQIIETVWDSAMMHEAATVLLKNFVYFSTDMKKGKERTVENQCIRDVADYVSQEEKQSIINNFLGKESDRQLSQIELKDKQKNEEQIERYLKQSTYKETSFAFEPKNRFSVILYLLSLLITMASVFNVLKLIEYNWGWLPVILSVVFFILAIIIIRKLYFRLWNKKLILQDQIGISL